MMIQVCEDIRVALELESQYWVQTFVQEGVSLGLALELQDAFENDLIYGASEVSECSPTSEFQVGHVDELISSEFVDLTLKE